VSYDLMVSDVTAAPRDRKAFRKWIEKQAEWQESHGYNNPDVPSAALRAWFHEIIKTYPPMNGPLASDDPDGLRVTDYSLGRTVIRAAFAWSNAEEAHAYAKALATTHGVGFFDASGAGAENEWPQAGWTLASEARRSIPLPLDLSFKEVLDKLDPNTNSFVILEQGNGSYIQCGGSKATCTVECRIHQSPETYAHYVVGHAEDEVLNATEAAELFALFMAGEPFPEKYRLRKVDI